MLVGHFVSREPWPFWSPNIACSNLADLAREEAVFWNSVDRLVPTFDISLSGLGAAGQRRFVAVQHLTMSDRQTPSRWRDGATHSMISASQLQASHCGGSTGLQRAKLPHRPYLRFCELPTRLDCACRSLHWPDPTFFRDLVPARRCLPSHTHTLQLPRAKRSSFAQALIRRLHT